MWRKKMVVLVVLTVLCLQLVVPPAASLAMVRQRNLEELAVEASRVIRGQVVKAIPHWNDDKTMIYTTVSVSVMQDLKGAGKDEITFEVPGGQVDDVGLTVEDAPEFAAGEEVILFLQDEYFQLVGWEQGKFTVVDDLVVEAEMMPVGQFIGQIDAALAKNGYAKVQAAAQKGTCGPGQTASTSAVFDGQSAPAEQQEEKGELPKGAVAPGGQDLEKATLQGWSTIMSEGFEGVFPPSWWHLYWGGNGYTWDDTSYKAYAGSWSGWCADGQHGTYPDLNPPGPYPINTRAWMVYGPFSLVGATDAKLFFRDWTRTENGYDWLNVYASINGSNFYGTGYSGDWATSCGWCSRTFDLKNVYTLGNLCGRSQVWIAFLFTSDGSVNYEGSYLDAISLQKYTATVPTITSISPTTASAGTNTQVTINGSGFGATMGTSTVKFWRVGSEWYTAPVVSWSNTQILCRVPAPASSHATQAVKVTTSTGTAYKGFTITFSYMGVKWPSPTRAKYYVYENTADCTGEAGQVRNGAHTWEEADYHTLALRYYGSTTRTAPTQDYYNVIRWGSTGGSIATCWTWWSGSNIVEFDIVLNDAYTWSTAAACPAGSMDVWNIAIHELGHGFGLLDLYGAADSEKTMYGYGANGETKKRSLATDDINGIRWIYP